MRKEDIAVRLRALRQSMQEQGLDAVILADQDPHGSEYVPDHWKRREWISGFNGSAGTAVVTLHEAALWTDSRYFLQAEAQLEGTEFILMREALPDTPSRPAWLAGVLSAGAVVGIDGGVHSVDEVEELTQALSRYGLSVAPDFVFADSLWPDCPSLPSSVAFVQPCRLAGRSVSEKLSALREALQAQGVEGLFIPTLDDVAWTLNIRANDIHCNPVKTAYLLVTRQEATFFVNPDEIDDEVRGEMRQAGVTVRPYDEVREALAAYPYASLWIDPAHMPYALRRCLPDIKLYCDPYTPAAYLKVRKNEVEIEGFRRAMLRDGVAMVRFLKWLEEAVPQGHETEMSIDRQLYAFRAEQELFKGISFDTIAGYKEHGAIVHYEATPETDKPLQPEGLLLLDSGAQYADGTTDITRTMALGPLTDEEKHDYTLVLKAHIALSQAKFPQGTYGTQLDALAHAVLWREGLNYMHGTGHGVGSYLTVHEGPHQIRASYKPALLDPGMTVTNEPGLYKAGRHGIRIENMMIVEPYMETEFGAFYGFSELTLCPIDTTPIVKEMMSDEELSWLDSYHATVYERLEGLLDEEHRAWLYAKTRPLGKKNE